MTVSIKDLISRPVDRRELLRFVGATGGAAAAARFLGAAPVRAADGPQLITSIRSVSNEYHAVWAKGGDAFAESVSLKDKHQVQTTEGDSQKGIASIKSALANSGKDTVINIDPNGPPDARPIVEAVEEAGGWIVTHWNKPDDLHPRDFKHYVAHIAYNGVTSGHGVATELFKAMGGKGRIVAVQGILDNLPAKERFEGLQRALAEYPEIKLLDVQPADWDQTKALNTMENWLTKYGDDITGVWAANDSMGLGCLEALRAQGKAGKVPIVGVDGTSQAVTAVVDGEFVATLAHDPFWQGGMGLSLGYHAWNGSIDLAKEPPEHREFYVKGQMVTKANAPEYLKTVSVGNVTYDWNDLWSRVDSAIGAQATPTT